MRLYITAKTNIPDLIIDYIEMILDNGEEINITWTESDIDRNEYGFDSRYKGLIFGDEDANGRIKELFDVKKIRAGVYTETEHGEIELFVESMEFCEYDEDGTENSYIFEGVQISGDNLIVN